MYTSVYIDLAFLSSAIGIWLFLLFNVILTFFAFMNGVSAEKEKDRITSEPFPFPFVSILIPCHNEGIVIERTIQSMLAMLYPKERMEILIINDGSDDDTAEITARMARRHREVKLVDIPKGEGGKGKSRALNIGLEHSMGDVIAIFDADNHPSPIPCSTWSPTFWKIRNWAPFWAKSAPSTKTGDI